MIPDLQVVEDELILEVSHWVHTLGINLLLKITPIKATAFLDLSPFTELRFLILLNGTNVMIL